MQRPHRFSTAIWKSAKVTIMGVAVACLLVLLSPLPSQAQPSQSQTRPNVLVILADDLGYSDIGCYGGEIETPNLNALAEGGIRFTQFYNTARCWPTRAALLTGYYAQQVRRDAIPGVPKTGGGGKRPPWAALLPEMLKPLGYRTYHSGKWHIDGQPTENGFDRSYYVLDQSRFFSPTKHFLDGKKLPQPKPDSGYYATIAIADHAVQCLQQHAKEQTGKPFFQYVAFTAPHFPLHALPQDIDKYRARYVCGWHEIRARRYDRIKSMGLLNCALSAVEREVGPPYHKDEWFEILGPDEVNRPLPWGELTASQRTFQSTKMAIHAAMVDRMDQEIGRIIRQLKAMDAYENTLILFLSDNGASAEIMVRGDGHDARQPFGSWATYLCLGPGWSTTANTPFRRHKTWVHEGGISTPLIAHWPLKIKTHGAIRTNPGHVIDIVPTVLEVTGGKPFTTWRGTDVPAAPGKSLVPLFAKDNCVAHDALWWLHEGHRAIRLGNWKLVMDRKRGEWELYDLSIDRAESNDLAARYPDKVRQLAEMWQERLDQYRQLAIGTPGTASDG